MIRAAIVDDEALARARLRRLLEAAGDIEIVAEAASGEEAIGCVPEAAPDVLFLDIHLRDLTGFDVLERLAGAAPPVLVFATAYDEHAVRAFEARALDYLLKPFDAARLADTLERVRERLGSRAGRLEGVRGLLDDLRRRHDSLERHVRDHAGAYSDRVLVRGEREMTLVPLRDVDWVGAADNYVELHAGPRTHLLRETLASFERRAGGAGFLRIHRGTLVNLDRLRSLRPTASGDLEAVLADGTVLAVSRTYRARLTAMLDGGATTGS